MEVAFRTVWWREFGWGSREIGERSLFASGRTRERRSRGTDAPAKIQTPTRELGEDASRVAVADRKFKRRFLHHR